MPLANTYKELITTCGLWRWDQPVFPKVWTTSTQSHDTINSMIPKCDKGPGSKTEDTFVRSSAAVYLTFAAAGGNTNSSVQMRYEDENIRLMQKMMAALYNMSVPAVNR